MLRNLILIFILTFSFLAKSEIVIDTVIFKGLTQTKSSYLRTLIKCEKGLLFDAKFIKEDEQVLNNLNLFFSVMSDWQYNESNNSYTVFFIIKESTYVYPLLSISGFKDVLKIQGGLNNINWRGEQKTIGVWYQYYDRHSFSAFHKVPHHKLKKTGHDFIISKYSTVEPLYFGDVKSFFDFDNFSVYLNGYYWLNKTSNIQLGLTPIYERYSKTDDVEIPQQETMFSFFKFRVNTQYTINKLNYKYERIDGFKFNFYTETIQTHKYPEASFFMIKSDFIYHRKVKTKGNLSFRHKIGISTNNDSPFSPFVLDGFLNLRGIGNRVARGTGINFINLEYKHTITNNKFFIGQVVGFFDSGNLREPGGNWQELISPSNSNNFAGLGIRIHSNKIYKTILRLDYGLEIAKEFNGGFSFGIGQFF